MCWPPLGLARGKYTVRRDHLHGVWSLGCGFLVCHTNQNSLDQFHRQGWEPMLFNVFLCQHHTGWTYCGSRELETLRDCRFSTGWTAADFFQGFWIPSSQDVPRVRLLDMALGHYECTEGVLTMIEGYEVTNQLLSLTGIMLVIGHVLQDIRIASPANNSSIIIPWLTMVTSIPVFRI